MAGIIKLDKDHSWDVAGWVFDQVLRLTRKHLPKEGSSRILEQMAKAEGGLSYLSLMELSSPEVSIFHDALKEAYREASVGGESFANPDFYAAFMERFRELLQMIQQIR